jgi:PhzF family phenazine biosynthesis protein
MQPPTYVIDTFTAPALTGNPTAVCYVEKNADDNTMPAIAAELNFPVTAFINKLSEGSYQIKYFTPTTQIPACGHATLAAAKAAQLHDGITSPTFRTTSNIIIKTSTEGDVIMMRYPKYNLQPVQITEATLQSLQLKNYKSAGYCKELETIFIELNDAATLRTIQPDYGKLVASNTVTKEVVITSVSDDKNYDFLLRSFCPWIGINEDPVTGSVHSVLAGFWSERLTKNELKAYQASERGGEILVRNNNGEVEIGGRMTVVQTPATHEKRGTNNQ